MATRDDYNAAQYAKFLAGTPDAERGSVITCSGKDCTGNIIDVNTNIVVHNGYAPETPVKCDTCDFGNARTGWRIALDLV